MNIFALHWRQRKAARWHCDKHVVKMLLETVQLLYTAHWVLAYPELRDCRSAVGLARRQRELAVPASMALASAPVGKNGCHYRPCHVWHPCAVWTRKTSGNYAWLAVLGLELAREFRWRYGHEHACEAHAVWLAANPPPTIRKWPRQPFAIAMDDSYKVSSDPIVVYRHYYRTAKADAGLLTYTRREMPHWLAGS